MEKFWEYMFLGGYAMIIYVMVRPGSQGPALVSNTFGGLASLAKAETGGGSW